MKCDYFGLCGSCSDFENGYDGQLKNKIEFIKNEFENSFEIGFFKNEFEVFSSDWQNYRYRAEFRIYHEYDSKKISFAMRQRGGKRYIKIDKCPIVSQKIDQKMQKLLPILEEDETLRTALYAIEFLSSDNEVLITLVYMKKINETLLEIIKNKNICQDLGVKIICRSKGIRLVAIEDWIESEIEILGKNYKYRLHENSFSQPNRGVNQKMISWAVEKSANFGGDLLELYCGMGNFTIPLAQNFNKVLATEISKSSIAMANENIILNKIKNISFARLSAKEMAQAYDRIRIFERLRGVELEEYDFRVIFVDPPRSGLDEESLELVKKIDNIIYISCNPQTLKRDLEELINFGYKINEFAIFDQFPYTHHIECGVILGK